MAWRNEPAPLSLRLLMVMVAASAAGSKRASPCNNTKSLPAHENSQDVEQTFSTLNGRILSLVLICAHESSFHLVYLAWLRPDAAEEDAVGVGVVRLGPGGEEVIAHRREPLIVANIVGSAADEGRVRRLDIERLVGEPDFVAPTGRVGRRRRG